MWFSVSLALFSFTLCSIHCLLPSFSVSLRSTVFILLQPPCFCGAVSVVDTMKTGRIHYLAPHSSHPLRFSLPTFSCFQQWIHFFIILPLFFLHCFEFVSLCLAPIFPYMVSFHFPFVFCSMRLSAVDWLILTIYLSLHLAVCTSHPLCTALTL